MFVLKQGWACLFGGLMLAALLVSGALWNPDWPLHRYDALVLFAIATQGAFLALRLETFEEARVILLFHLTGTVMEVFKVYMGSWSYPDPGALKLLGVPLFSGFMYASVGSYMARVMRIFDMRFAPYPPYWLTVVLAAAIYINFFTHHFIADVRWLLIPASVVLFAGTRIWFTLGHRRLWMPLPLAAFFTSLFLWLAEYIGTSTRTWVYGGTGDGMVSFTKIGSWYLLLYVSFATVTLVFRQALEPGVTETPAAATR